MKRTRIETDNTVTGDMKTNCPQAPYPMGYARPEEKEAWERYQKNLKKLPESIANMRKSQEEAAKNGLSEEILEKLLTEDAA